MPTHEFTPPPAGATLHAVDGPVRYLRVDWIMRQEMNGRPEYYCATDDWETTPAGRLADKDREIAALQHHIAELESRLAAPTVPPAVAEAATPAEPGQAGMAVPHGLVCPDCGQNSFKNAHALRVHRGRAHGTRTAAPLIVALVADDPTWRCESCGSDRHARSVTQPGLCLRCAAQLNCANGAEAADV